MLEINAYLDEISNYMKEQIEPTMSEYGIELLNFCVNDISTPEDDPGVKKLKDALAKKAEMDIIGYNYQQERSFDTMEGAANNQGSTSSGILGAGMGLGMGLNVGNAVGSQFSNVAQVMGGMAQGKIECQKCHSMMEKNVRFCPSCGNEVKNPGIEKSDFVKCSNCGTSYPINTKFCPDCGNKYNPCPNCGVDVPDGAVTCTVCGHDLPTPCPNCGALMEAGKVKFCPECGTSIVKKCKKCDAAINGNPKFCPECGEKL